MEEFKNAVNKTDCGDQDVRFKGDQEGFKGETVELLTLVCNLSIKTFSALLENR